MNLKSLKYKKYKTEFISVFAGILIIVLNMLLLPKSMALVSPLINLMGGLIAFIPSFWHFYAEYRKRTVMEEQFINFTYDLSESIKSGMNLPLALKHSSKNDYLSLNPYVNKLAAQVDWGIPFGKALSMLATKTRSVPIKRSIATIIETYKVGGEVAKTLSSVSSSLRLINRIKKERKSSIFSQIFTSYLIYFVFIFILVILQIFLLPMLMPIEEMTTGGPMGGGMPIEAYGQSFLWFIIIQGFFAGLVTGKLAEGSFISGLKHSVFLIAIGYTIFSMAIALSPHAALM
ncbi:MAG: type II secretion system F family protein [Candidatus Aenigmarchaeota archaeon]|nr:type II secretion system F family protein [Candidatus Aenigmarchaeota archaeon]